MISVQYKAVSRDHISEKRFDAYSKARDYIKHLNSVYERKHYELLPEESYKANQGIKDQLSIKSNHRLSLMPTSMISSKVKKKIDLINIFHNLSEQRIRQNIVKTKSITPVRKRIFDNYFKSKRYSQILNQLSNDNYIRENKPIYETFLTGKAENTKEDLHTKPHPSEHCQTARRLHSNTKSPPRPHQTRSVAKHLVDTPINKPSLDLSRLPTITKYSPIKKQNSISYEIPISSPRSKPKPNKNFESVVN